MRTKILSLIVAVLLAIADVYAEVSNHISPEWAGIAGAGIALVYLSIRTLTKYARGRGTKRIFSTTEFWACAIACVANLGLAVAERASWEQSSTIVIVLSILVRLARIMNGPRPQLANSLPDNPPRDHRRTVRPRSSSTKHRSLHKRS